MDKRLARSVLLVDTAGLKELLVARSAQWARQRTPQAARRAALASLVNSKGYLGSRIVACAPLVSTIP